MIYASIEKKKSVSLKPSNRQGESRSTPCLEGRSVQTFADMSYSPQGLASGSSNRSRKLQTSVPGTASLCSDLWV